MATAAPRRMTLAEFLEWHDDTDTCYELIDGEIVAIAPPRDVHGTIVMNLGIAIGPRLKPPCRVVGNAGIAGPSAPTATTSPTSR
jgi:Uma2 family endonuclease